VLIFSVSACSNRQIISNIEQTPIASSMTNDNVQIAIITAANRRGWLIEEMTDKEIILSLQVRNHNARVRVAYTTENYSIIYVSSVNLKHKGNKIHGNYNRWVNNLDIDIRRELSLMTIKNKQ
jgi:hypothetical protein